MNNTEVFLFENTFLSWIFVRHNKRHVSCEHSPSVTNTVEQVFKINQVPHEVLFDKQTLIIYVYTFQVFCLKWS